MSNIKNSFYCTKTSKNIYIYIKEHQKLVFKLVYNQLSPWTKMNDLKLKLLDGIKTY